MSNSNRSFHQIVHDYLEDTYRFNPGLAAYAGVHSYDGDLEDYSPDAINAQIAMLKDHRAILEKIDINSLNLSDQIDHQIVCDHIDGRLLDLIDLRIHETTPALYVGGLFGGLSQSLLRQVLYDFAPKTTRLSNVITKLQRLPQMVANAKTTLKNPPPILVDTGLMAIKGAISLIERDLPRAFADVDDTHLRNQFSQTLEPAIASLRSLAQFVDEDLRKQANGQFALGVENYQKLLRYKEGVTTPLDQLLKLGLAELARTQAEFIETARLIDNQASPLAIWRRIQEQHPAAGQLVTAAQGQLDQILQFIEARKLVSWPKAEPAQVAPTPEFYRWSFASMVAPGPLEERALPSRYFITDVDPSWPVEQQQQHLTYFSYPILWSISIHEVYPGHFAQFAHLKDVKSIVRRNPVFMPMSYIEGWAHYTEQMMFEAGFLADQTEMKLGQLWEAILRLCRFIVAIKLHTDGMTIEQATQFFIDNAYAEAAPARSEASRGSFDPLYLSYTLGKLQILELRADYQRARGADYSLHQFHHQLLSEGMAPIDYHRRLMLD